MPDAPPSNALFVQIDGLLRGAELSGAAEVLHVPGSDALMLRTSRGDRRVPLEWLEGIVVHDDAVELYLSLGDVLQLSGQEELRALGATLLTDACALPEFTRSLRGLGASRAEPDADHDRFFAPLLDACRRALAAASFEGSLRAFDATSLRSALMRRLREVAAERYPKAAPERRALEAELMEIADPVLEAFGALERAQTRVREAPDAEMLTYWRRWTAALQAVFSEADVCWLAARFALRVAAPAPRRWWQRWKSVR